MPYLLETFYLRYVVVTVMRSHISMILRMLSCLFGSLNASYPLLYIGMSILDVASSISYTNLKPNLIESGLRKC